MKTILKNLLFATIAVTLSVSSSLAQKKKVAVVTFYANKYVGADNMSGAAGLSASIAALAKDTNFNLKPILNKFHEKFFNEYSKEFPFELANESEVINDSLYKAFSTLDTSSILAYNALLKTGYNYSQVSPLYKKDLRRFMEIYKDKYDGFLWVFLHFQISPKVAMGGMGVAGIQANASIYCYNKSEDKVFTVHEYCMSKGSVGMVAGLPIMKTKEILPLCNDASEKLLSDLYNKLPKIARKSAKNL